MIVSTSIDADGAVTVTVDSDGDHGDGYSTEVLEDLASRSNRGAIAAWLALHTEPADEDTESEDAGDEAA